MKPMVLIAVMLISATCLKAQANLQNSENTKELVFLAGTIQPLLLQGGNFQVDFYTPKWVLSYSHGFALRMEHSAGTTVGAAQAQSVAYYLPYSTGFGVGYRLNEYFDIRLEPKFHRFDAFYEGTNRNEAINQITEFCTFTLGVGAYFRWKPFENQQNFLSGIFTSTSLRYWPNLWTSLENNEYSYYNRVTNRQETLTAANIGIANSPIIFNIALGYSIKF